MNIDLYLIFSGQWSVSRQLNGTLFFEGDALFVSTKNGPIKYTEKGTVTHPNGHVGLGQRTYYFLIEDSGFFFSAYFDDQCAQIFHSVKVERNNGEYVGQGNHKCLEDLYTSRYRFTSIHRWEWEHQVVGPKKNYLITSQYRRKEYTDKSKPPA